MKAASHGQSEKQLLQLSKRLQEKEENCVSLQHKVRELESKLREGEQSESAAYEQKELEMKLKDKVQESEYNSLVLHRKIKELEKRLRDHEQNPEIGFLQLKVKELEEKLRRSQCLPPSEAAAKARPNEAKRAGRDLIMSNVDSSQNLRSSNSTIGSLSRDPQAGVPNTKEKDSKKRIWSR